MPFGKHKGRPLAELPDGYLRWLAGLATLREPLRTAVYRESERRRYTGPSHAQTGLPIAALPIAEELITLGYRALTRRYHPDVGGDHQSMVLVNTAATWLRDAVRGTA
jgi:hypothetical protein